VLKGAFQGTVLYSIPLIGQRIASILLLSIVTRVLTPADFGMLSLLEQVGAVLSILLCGAFSASLGYFYFDKDTERDRGAAVGTAAGGAFLLGLMAALVGWGSMGFLARDVFRSADALRYLPLVLIGMPFDFGGEAMFGWLRVADRQSVFARISLLRIGITAAGIVVLVGILKMRVMAYLSTTLTCQIVIGTLLVVYLFRNTQVSFSTALFNRMFRFSVPLLLSMVAMFVINFGDQFVLRHYRPMSEVGIYALAYKIGMVVAAAYSSFHSYWNAQVYRIMRMEDAEAVFARLFTYAVLLVVSATLVLTICADPGLRVLARPAFRAAVPLIPMLAAANGIRSIGEFLRSLFLAAGRPAYKACCEWIGLTICVALYFLLIPRYGMWGGAIATLATFVAMVCLSVVWTYRMSRYRVERSRLLKMAAVVAVIMALYYAVPVTSLSREIAWSALLLALFPAGLWALQFPTAGERRAIASVLQRAAGSLCRSPRIAG
jgi:O-antigen/teichoic acid export membrane protein